MKAFILIASVLFFGVAHVAAATCTNSYGSTVDCPTNGIQVNKQVRSAVNKNVFYENISSAQTPYNPGDEVEYKITVTNTSDVTYSEVTVNDILPAGLTFLSGPDIYTQDKHTMNYKIYNLKPGTHNSVTSRFTAKLNDAAYFKQVANKCDPKELQNYVKVSGPNGASDEDTANLCIATDVLGATHLPVAGINDWAAALPFVASGLAGLGLFIKGRKRQP